MQLETAAEVGFKLCFAGEHLGIKRREGDVVEREPDAAGVGKKGIGALIEFGIETFGDFVRCHGIEKQFFGIVTTAKMRRPGVRLRELVGAAHKTFAENVLRLADTIDATSN